MAAIREDLGLYHYRCHRDYERALLELDPDVVRDDPRFARLLAR